MMKSRTKEEIRSRITREFLVELVEELIDAAADYGRHGDDLSGDNLNTAAEKLYNVVEALEIES